MSSVMFINVCWMLLNFQQSISFFTEKRTITYRGARLSRGSLLASRTRWSNHSLLSRRTSGTRITTETARSILTSWTRGARGSNNTLRGEDYRRVC